MDGLSGSARSEAAISELLKKTTKQK